MFIIYCLSLLFFLITVIISDKLLILLLLKSKLNLLFLIVLNFKKNFCACERACADVLVPTNFCTFFQFLPYNVIPSMNFKCSSYDHLPSLTTLLSVFSFFSFLSLFSFLFFAGKVVLKVSFVVLLLNRLNELITLWLLLLILLLILLSGLLFIFSSIVDEESLFSISLLLIKVPSVLFELGLFNIFWLFKQNLIHELFVLLFSLLFIWILFMFEIGLLLKKMGFFSSFLIMSKCTLFFVFLPRKFFCSLILLKFVLIVLKFIFGLKHICIVSLFW